jgi:hypothetical protein
MRAVRDMQNKVKLIEELGGIQREVMIRPSGGCGALYIHQFMPFLVPPAAHVT